VRIIMVDEENQGVNRAPLGLSWVLGIFIFMNSFLCKEMLKIIS
jgi:hypothetical protein